MNRTQTTSRIRIHELATELDASPDDIVDFLRDQGEKVRDRSTVVGLSVARTVRKRFGPKPSAGPSVPEIQPSVQFSAPVPVAVDGPASGPASGPVAAPGVDMPQFLPAGVGIGSPFLPPVPTASALGASAAARPGGTLDSVAPAVLGEAENGRANAPDEPSLELLLTAARAKGSRPTTGVPAGSRLIPQQAWAPDVAPVTAPAPAPELDEKWRRAGIDAERQAAWMDAGLRATDSSLADQCTVMGLGPADLPVKLAGRTALQRLRDGEPVPSVWARIEEHRQQPAKIGSRLTGRFKQA